MNGQMSRLDETHLRPVLLCAMNLRHRPLWKPACTLPMPGAHEFPFRSRRLSVAIIRLALKQFRTIWHNGALATPLASIVSAIFPMRRRGCPFLRTCIPCRMNTYKSVSKQMALSIFRINTYANPRAEVR